MVIDFQIKEQYETYQRTPEEIAESEGLDVVAVKAKLLQVSNKYRKDVGACEAGENPLDFTDAQMMDANQTIYQTMLRAELPDGTPDYRTRLKAAEYIRDDKKGRKELRALLQGNQFNILNFNEALQSARQKADAIKKSVMPPMINV